MMTIIDIIVSTINARLDIHSLSSLSLNSSVEQSTDLVRDDTVDSCIARTSSISEALEKLDRRVF